MGAWDEVARRSTAAWRAHPTATLFVTAIILGGLAGLLSAAFWNAIAALSAAVSFYMVRPWDAALPMPWSWSSWMFLMPALGGLLVGVLAHHVLRTPDRLGVPAVMLDARREWGRIPLRYVPATFVNGTLTIDFGGSAGREAPVVAMGGGLGVAVISLAAPGALGNGYPWTIAACEGRLAWQVMLLLTGAKIVATALTLGSGGWGGDFAPTLLVGAMTGGVYGALLSTLLSGSVAGAGAYAMVEMGAVLAAVIRCPVTAVLLLFELTGSYEVVLPGMVAITLAAAVARRLSAQGLYHKKLCEFLATLRRASA